MLWLRPPTGMLPEIGCRLVGVDDFGATVRFTCPGVGGVSPVLVARVERVRQWFGGLSADFCRPADGAADSDRLGRVIEPLLSQIAERAGP